MSDVHNVFISYSRKDKKYLDELHTHLAHYERAGKVTYWDDTRILPGSKWYEEITKALQSARVAVFLVSADFLASDFIMDHELAPLLQAAKQTGTVIFSIILGACAFKYTALAQYQAMNDPKTPLNQMAKGKRDLFWTEVAELIEKNL